MNLETKTYSSWGNILKVKSPFLTLKNRLTPFKFQSGFTYLAYGLGRSYGDSCLSHSSTMIESRSLRNFISFDEKSGVLNLESGVSFDEILKVFVPKGWFLPVTPGTKFVTVGGAIANDVHGKNHHNAGSLGHFLLEITLLRSDGSIINCNEAENRDLFKATIGGLGLTGFILSAKLNLIPIKSSYLEVTTIKFNGLQELLKLSSELHNSTYTVAWYDCYAQRGLFMHGEHSSSGILKPHSNPKFFIPCFFPGFILNSLFMRIFNWLYFHKQLFHKNTKLQHYDSFFYPLDAINEWNKIYGKNGFYQYQCVLPYREIDKFQEILDLISISNQGSFLCVIKTFGHLKNKGLLSFPIEGITLCLDFKNLNNETTNLFSKLNEIVRNAGGRIYPAKDFNMTASDFHMYYNDNIASFKKFVDPHFASALSERLNITNNG